MSTDETLQELEGQNTKSGSLGSPRFKVMKRGTLREPKKLSERQGEQEIRSPGELSESNSDSNIK